MYANAEEFQILWKLTFITVHLFVLMDPGAAGGVLNTNFWLPNIVGHVTKETVQTNNNKLPQQLVYHEPW